MKKILKGIATACMSVAVCISFAACGGKGADRNFNDPDGSKYSIITKLDLKVDFKGDKASATVKNTFTLFPAEARVQVYLYYSETEADTYAGMTEVATGSTEDLDQGKSLTASWDTKGRGGYFLGRMRYRIDNREWEEKCTDLYVREYTKPVLEPIADDGSLPVFEDVEPALPYMSYKNIYDYEHIYEAAHFSYETTENDTSYESFENEELKKFTNSLGKEFYIFNAASEGCHIGANSFFYDIYRGKESYILNKDMLIYVPKLGFENPPELELITGLGLWNIDFDLMFINIDGVHLSGKLKLQFGVCDKPFNTANDKFINLYIGDFCIGTCYYKSVAAIEATYAFYYNLFAEGLRII